MQLPLWILVGASVPALAAGAPTVFWASQPVAPGQTVMLVGSGFGDKPTVQVGPVDDGPAGPPTGPLPAPHLHPAEVLQASDQVAKFVLPRTDMPGVFLYLVTGPEGTVAGVLNRPAIWWAQGDPGVAVSPGGWVRIFGACLAPEGSGLPRAAAPLRPRVLLRGAAQAELTAEGDAWALKATLPANLPPGEYRLYVHNGYGGSAGWSEAKPLTVARAVAWPGTVFNARDFGADGTGERDDTAAVQAALDAAGKAGGGVVFLPRGRYRLTEGITVPRFTILRGEREDLTCLLWPDLEAPPEALVRGSNSFGIEDLTLYASRHRNVIAGEQGDQPGAGDVFLRRVRVRADAYRGHPTEAEVAARFRDAQKLSTGGGDTVAVGGRNVEITDCDLYGSGRALYMSRVRGGRVSGTTLSNGRWGWYCISGSDGVIFEDNRIVGADLMSTGGGLNCLDGSAYSQNVYYARNRLMTLHGWDREAMTSDAGGDVYFGSVAGAEGPTLTLAQPPRWGGEAKGAGVFILDGTGAGQYRRVVGHQGNRVDLDRPWQVPPDATSRLCITMFQGHYMLLDNEFTDTGAMQFYGTAVECVVAGNRGTRMQGFRALGLWYDGFQPSWYCQFLGNQILEGNYYHWSDATEARLDIYGAKQPPYNGPLNLGAVVRGNHLHSNARINVEGTCRDLVVEQNTVENAETGVFVSRQCTGALVRDNTFRNVAHGVVDEEAQRQAALERMKRFWGKPEPVGAWSFETLSGKRYTDDSGNFFHATPVGGVTQVEGGIRGKCLKFDGTGYLRVDEPAVFNSQDVTVSLWVKPATLAGRRGLIAKRFNGCGCPFVLSHTGASFGFEAEEEGGAWTFNFSTGNVLREGQWTHLVAVARGGEGVRLYVNGQEVARRENKGRRTINDEPLIFGREAWGGDPPRGETPGFYVGLMDEVRIWTRALGAEEVKAEYQRVKPAGLR